ncbi:hypothetical protein [Streptomyces sp. NBC_00212]|uniref:hypothetical protein n=1 Tax=Streptomyces sp. NBC_00212 TaxID=2975684 RepID=UPI002F911408
MSDEVVAQAGPVRLDRRPVELGAGVEVRLDVGPRHGRPVDGVLVEELRREEQGGRREA